MKLKKMLSVIFVFVMIFPAISGSFSLCAESMEGAKSAKSSNDEAYMQKREVYLHAQSSNPTGVVASSTVLKNEPFNLYFSIDNPNKGTYNYDENDSAVKDFIDSEVEKKRNELLERAEEEADAAGVSSDERAQFIEEWLAPKLLAEARRAEQIIRHEKPMYDLNGYTVRIYYDKNYFSLKDGVNPNEPIDYTVPDKTISDADTSTETEEDILDAAGYSATFEVGYDNDRGLDYAQIRVFFYGSFLPQETGDEKGTKWYDLCALPLVPEKTGTSRVSIEVSGDDSKGTLVLYSKHQNDPDFSKYFEYSAVNGGIHTINIVNSMKPLEPSATPLPIDYIKGDKVKLICKDSSCAASEEMHDIYYSLDGGQPYQKYEGQELSFDKTTVVYCYCVKKTDTEQKNKSNTVSFKYEVLPDKPVLFVQTDGQPITNVYNADSAFKVYCDICDPEELKYDINDIDADTNIFYTYSDILAEEFIDSTGKFKTDGENAETEWVKVEKSTGLSINIDKTVKMKLVTVRENSLSGQELSEVATYLLGIKPGDVVAEPSSGENPGKVELSMENAEDGCEIYYTVDGSDPITAGIKYNGKISIEEDTIIRAVAKKEGIYGDISEFSYTVTNNTGSVISSNYPSGEYEGGINVYLTSTNPGEEILYSTDNAVSWNTYTGKIDVDKSTLIKAKIQQGGETFEFSYTIKPLAPVFVPTGTYFGQTDYVTIYCRETINNINGTNKDDYTLYYTTDGTDPTKNVNAYDTSGNPVNTAVVEVGDYVVIKAAVKTKDGIWSDVVTNTYDVVAKKLAAPMPTLEPGYYTAEKMFTEFFKEQDGTEIYYTVSYNDVYEKDPVASEELPNMLYKPGQPIELSGRMIIKAVAVNKNLNLKSDVAVFEYVVNPEPETHETLYADKKSGVYDESSEPFIVHLHSENPSDVIQYKINGGNWEAYDDSAPLTIAGDSVLYIKTDDENIVSYTYEFIPKPPVATLMSGRYAKTEPPAKVQIKLPLGYTIEDGYYLYVRDNEGGEDFRVGSATGELEINASVSYKAYVVNENTGKRSENAVFYYIVEPESALSGDIFTQSPYQVVSGDKKYISTHLLSKSGYNDGIKLDTHTAGARIKYKYIYTKADGNTGGTDYQFYDAANPIMVTSAMSDMIVYAYLTDSLGNEIIGSDCEFSYVFVDLLIPQFSSDDFTIKNDYPGDDDYLIFYTLDNSDPTNPAGSRVLYPGGNEVITLNGDTTVKTVYYKACGEPTCSACLSGRPLLCADGVYGDIGIFNYKAPVFVPVDGGSGGGGGGGSYNTRKYTKDIFGNEHMTHISYIKGYPDGTVKADGNITREEVTAILYRIKNKDYEEPFTATGTVFPDVQANRWSVTEIEYMAQYGVVLGYPDGEFKPSANLTRAEFAALIYRFVDLRKVNIQNKFSDLSQEHWAYNEIIALLNKGLMQGYEDGTFRPENDITRAEVITVINKILGRKPLPSYVKSLNFNPFSDLDSGKWYYVDVLEATITHDYFLNGNGYENEWENWK